MRKKTVLYCYHKAIVINSFVCRYFLVIINMTIIRTVTLKYFSRNLFFARSI
uniref:Uncharacterized protein n=1 Tax=Anguilla anguilla TaxID=7936 RepID=A0A0E9Q002_ANGAN